MKKILFASIILLSCAIGFFLGALYNSPNCSLNSENKAQFQQQQVKGKENFPDKNFKKTPPHKKKGKFFSQELDSLLQLSSEQRLAMEGLRKEQDSAFSQIKQDTRNAEKELRQVLDADIIDSVLIQNAKIKILEMQEKALNQRISGKMALSKILTSEQKLKMKEIHKNRFEKHKKRLEEKNKTENTQTSEVNSQK